MDKNDDSQKLAAPSGREFGSIDEKEIIRHLMADLEKQRL